MLMIFYGNIVKRMKNLFKRLYSTYFKVYKKIFFNFFLQNGGVRTLQQKPLLAEDVSWPEKIPNFLPGTKNEKILKSTYDWLQKYENLKIRFCKNDANLNKKFYF